MALQVGSKFKVVKGCVAFGLNKGMSGKVLDIKPFGREYNYNVRIHLEINGRSLCLWARHPNRLEDAEIRLIRGNPLEYVEIQAMEQARMPKIKKITETQVLEAFDRFDSNPYTSTNDYYFDQDKLGNWWVLGEDGRKWWLCQDKQGAITFIEHKVS